MDGAELVDRVTETTQAAARAVREAATARPALPYPSVRISLCVAELRDLYILSAWSKRVGEHPSGVAVDGMELADARWPQVMLWVVAHCRGVISLSGSSRTTPGRVIGHTEQGVALMLSPHTSWMDQPVAARIYEAVWRLKRFVSSGGIFEHARQPSITLVLVSDAVERTRMTSVRVTRRVPSQHLVDVRVWQVVLALAGQGELVMAAGRAIRDVPTTGGMADARRAVPVLPVGAVSDEFFLDVVLWAGPAPTTGQSEGESADAALAVLVAELTTFQTVLWLSLVRVYGTDAAGARTTSKGPRRDGRAAAAGSGRSVEPLKVRLIAALAAEVVRDVVRGWDALARAVSFEDIESMVAPYLIWNGRSCSFAALARPLDRGAFAPLCQQRELWHSVGPVVAAAVGDAGLVSEQSVNRSVLADEQLRQVAHGLLEHLQVCTSSDNLADLAAEHLRVRAAAVAGGAPDAGSADAARGRADKPPLSLAQSSSLRLGALTVFRYRPPSWSGDAGSVPRVLRNVRLGLTAFPENREASRSGAGRVSAAQRASSGGNVSLQEHGPDSSLQATTGGGRRASRRLHRQAAVVEPLTLYKARLMVKRVMDAVVSVYSCSFEQLSTVHTSHLDALRAVASSSGGSSGAASGGSCGSKSGGGSGSSESSCNTDRAGERASEVPLGPGGRAADVLPRSLAGTVQLVLTDPPYNIRRLGGKEWSKHDELSEADMRVAVELFRVLLRPGGHLLIFASPAQHQSWVNILRSAVDEVSSRAGYESDDEEDREQGEQLGEVSGGGGRSRKRLRPMGVPSFRVDSAPLLIIKDPHAFTAQRRSSTNLSRKVEFVVHATRCGADAQTAYERVNFRTFNSVPSRFAAHLNVIDNVRPPLYHEVVRRPGYTDARSFKWMRPEQKSLALMEELVQRFSQPRDVVVDPFGGTCSTGLACLRIPMGQYRLAVCCDSDAEVIQASMGRLRREVVDQLRLGNFQDVANRSFGAAAVRRAADFLSAHEGEAAGGAARGDSCGVSAPPPAVSAGSSSSAIGPAGSAAAVIEHPSSASVKAVESDAERQGQLDALSGARGTSALSEDSFMLAPRAVDLEGDWAAPSGLPCHSALPVGMLRFLATRWAAAADEARAGRPSHPRSPPAGRSVASQVLRLEGVGLSEWPPAMQAAYGVEDAELLRNVSAASLGLYIARSMFAGGTSGVGVFSGRRIREGEVVASYFGAIVYADLGSKRNKTVRYAPAVLGSHAPTSDDFVERALEVRVRKAVAAVGKASAPGGAAGAAASDPKSGRGRPRARARSDGLAPVWIVASPTCVAGYVNDFRPTGAADEAALDAEQVAGRSGLDDGDARMSPAEGREPRSGLSAHPLQACAAAAVIGANVKLQVVSGASTSAQQFEELTVQDLVRPDAVVLVAMRAIDVDEELVLDYGSQYQFRCGSGGQGGGRQHVSRSTPHTFTAVPE